MPLASQQTLIALLREHSVKWGDFTLKSGKKSDLYVDVRRTALHQEGARAIGLAVHRALLPGIQAVGGVELGAVPIVGSVLAVQEFDSESRGNARVSDPRIPGFIIRKAAKEHGTKSLIENCPAPGTKVAIVEDVTTTAGSLIAAMNTARDAGLVVIQAITIVDRQEGAVKAFKEAGWDADFTFTPIVTRTDLLPT